MKKLTTTLLSVVILVFSFGLTGCYNGGTFTAKAYSSQGQSISSITINVSDREVTVSASADNDVHIDYSDSEKEFYEIAVSADNELTMVLTNSKTWTDFIGTQPAIENRKISLKIPHSLLSNLTIVTTNENIKLSPISAIDTVTLNSDGGSIELGKANVNKALSLTAKNGDITGTIIGSYDAFSIACEIKKGECNLPLSKADGAKALKVNCNNGDIALDFAKA